MKGFQLRLPLAVRLVDIDPVGRVALRPARLAQADRQDDLGVGGFGFLNCQSSWLKSYWPGVCSMSLQ